MFFLYGLAEVRQDEISRTKQNQVLSAWIYASHWDFQTLGFDHWTIGMNICRLRWCSQCQFFGGSAIWVLYQLAAWMESTISVLVDCKLPIDSVCLRNTADNQTRYFAQQKFEQSVNVCSQELDFFAGWAGLACKLWHASQRMQDLGTVMGPPVLSGFVSLHWT
jgi:hypothetical protein